MIYQINTLVDKVQALTGEGETHPAFPEPCDCTSTARRRIAMTLTATATAVHASAPAHLLTDIRRRLSTDKIFWHKGRGALHRGHIIVPPDFMRLLTLKLSDWSRPVHTVTAHDTVDYHLLHSDNDAFAGSPQRPACYLREMPEGQALVFSASKSKHAEIEEGYYIPYPEIAPDGTIAIAAQLLNEILQKTIASL